MADYNSPGFIDQISLEDVAAAIPFATKPESDYSPFNLETKQQHINRIAWYAANGWGSSSITIDFTAENWLIFDGNHRLAAAIYRGDEMIWADVYGSKKQIASLYQEEEVDISLGVLKLETMGPDEDDQDNYDDDYPEDPEPSEQGE